MEPSTPPSQDQDELDPFFVPGETLAFSSQPPSPHDSSNHHAYQSAINTGFPVPYLQAPDNSLVVPNNHLHFLHGPISDAAEGREEAKRAAAPYAPHLEFKSDKGVGTLPENELTLSTAPQPPTGYINLVDVTFNGVVYGSVWVNREVRKGNHGFADSTRQNCLVASEVKPDQDITKASGAHCVVVWSNMQELAYKLRVVAFAPKRKNPHPSRGCVLVIDQQKFSLIVNHASKITLELTFNGLKCQVHVQCKSNQRPIPNGLSNSPSTEEDSEPPKKAQKRARQDSPTKSTFSFVVGSDERHCSSPCINGAIFVPARIADQHFTVPLTSNRTVFDLFLLGASPFPTDAQYHHVSHYHSHLLLNKRTPICVDMPRLMGLQSSLQHWDPSPAPGRPFCSLVFPSGRCIQEYLDILPLPPSLDYQGAFEHSLTVAFSVYEQGTPFAATPLFDVRMCEWFRLVAAADVRPPNPRAPRADRPHFRALWDSTWDALSTGVPLHHFCRSSWADMVHHLLLLNYDPSQQLRRTKATAFHLAAWRGSRDVMQTLLESDFTNRTALNLEDYAGATPLDVAAHYKRPDIVALLWRYGARPKLFQPAAMSLGASCGLEFRLLSPSITHADFREVMQTRLAKLRAFSNESFFAFEIKCRIGWIVAACAADSSVAVVGQSHSALSELIVSALEKANHISGFITTASMLHYMQNMSKQPSVQSGCVLPDGVSTVDTDVVLGYLPSRVGNDELQSVQDGERDQVLAYSLNFERIYSKRVLLCIGTNDGANAALDATYVRDAFTKAWKTIPPEQKDFIDLIYEPSKPVTVRRLRHWLALIGAKPSLNNVVDSNSLLVVYFAGHGQRRDNELHLHLDPDPKNPSAPQSIPFSLLKDVLQSTPAAHSVVFLDCCFSGQAIMHEPQPVSEDPTVPTEPTESMTTSESSATRDSAESDDPKREESHQKTPSLEKTPFISSETAGLKELFLVDQLSNITEVLAGPDPMPIHKLVDRTPSGESRLDLQALKHIIGADNLNVMAIIGGSGGGKSTLSNAILHLAGETGSWFSASKKASGTTIGIDVFHKQITLKPEVLALSDDPAPQRPVSFILMDVEGTGHLSASGAARTLLPAMITAQVVVYNILARPKLEEILTELSVLAEVGRRVRGSYEGPIFGHLAILCRDWVDMEDSTVEGILASITRLEAPPSASSTSSPDFLSGIADRNARRTSILNSFSSISVHGLPRPFSSVDDFDAPFVPPERLSVRFFTALKRFFVNVADKFTGTVSSGATNRIALSGEILVRLSKHVVEKVSSDDTTLDVGSLWMLVQQSIARKETDKATQRLQEGLDRLRVGPLLLCARLEVELERLVAQVSTSLSHSLLGVDESVKSAAEENFSTHAEQEVLLVRNEIQQTILSKAKQYARAKASSLLTEQHLSTVALPLAKMELKLRESLLVWPDYVEDTEMQRSILEAELAYLRDNYRMPTIEEMIHKLEMALHESSKGLIRKAKTDAIACEFWILRLAKAADFVQAARLVRSIKGADYEGTLLSEAYRLDPSNFPEEAPLLVDLGNFYRGHHFPDVAEKMFQRAVAAAQPTPSAALVSYGIFKKRCKNFASAVDILQEAYDARPRSSSVFVALLSARRKLNPSDVEAVRSDAVLYLEQAFTECGPKEFVKVLWAVWKRKFVDDDFVEAKAKLLVESHRAVVEVWAMLFVGFMNLQLYGKASAYAEKAYQTHLLLDYGDIGESAAALGLFYWRHCRPENLQRAAECLRRGVEFTTGSAPFTMYSQFLEDHKRYEELEWLKKAYQSGPGAGN
eukprot:TRINITY_DN2360_c1_g2_i1.p1 TRINITY_DN2360_c1_g2~~TRINITY_DN2360_c1_g2_i1.p1  ORF type:complete len:1795 (-),score=177.83 TRINITY_DN2360_c1_g2_i1:44-5428(-)